MTYAASPPRPDLSIISEPPRLDHPIDNDLGAWNGSMEVPAAPVLLPSLYGLIFSFLNNPLKEIQTLRLLNREINNLVNDGSFWLGTCPPSAAYYIDPATFAWTPEVPQWYRHLLTNRMRAFDRRLTGRCSTCTPFTRVRLSNYGIGYRLIQTGIVEIEVSTTLAKREDTSYTRNAPFPSAVSVEVQFRDTTGEMVGTLITRVPVPIGTALIELHFDPRTPHHFARNTSIRLTLNLNTKGGSLRENKSGTICRLHSLPLVAHSPPSDRHNLGLKAADTKEFAGTLKNDTILQHGSGLVVCGSMGYNLWNSIELMPSEIPPVFCRAARSERRIAMHQHHERSLSSNGYPPMVELRLRCQTQNDSKLTLVMSEGPTQWSWTSISNWKQCSSRPLTVRGGIALAISDTSFRNPLTLRVSVLSRERDGVPATTILYIDKAVLTWIEEENA